MIIHKSDAIRSLIGGIAPDDGQTPPTDSEIDTEIIRLQAEYNANQYQRDRKYPDLEEQLDMQYWDQVNGTTTWKDAVAKVKADNPKE
jgi:hypothetical protein